MTGDRNRGRFRAPMRLLACSLVLITTHAFADSKVDPTGATDTEALRGSVLVWHDAQLFTEASDTARSIQLATFEGARKDRIGHVVAMKVVSAKRAFVEVELTGAQDCNWSHVTVPDDLAKVRLFVRRADLAPVLVKPYAQTFGDGTSITLDAGTPIVTTTSGAHVVSLRGVEVEVDVPAASVGHAYAARSSNRPIAAGETLAVAAGTSAILGERTLTLGATQGAPVDRRANDTTLIALDDRCFSARVSVPTKALADVEESSTIDVGGGGGGSVLDLRDEYYLPKLTLLSAGKRQVAIAAKPIYLIAEPTGKSACIDRKIKIESAIEINATNEKLRLCAPAAKVAREKLRSARSAFGTTRR